MLKLQWLIKTNIFFIFQRKSTTFCNQAEQEFKRKKSKHLIIILLKSKKKHEEQEQTTNIANHHFQKVEKNRSSKIPFSQTHSIFSQAPCWPQFILHSLTPQSTPVQPSSHTQLLKYSFIKNINPDPHILIQIYFYLNDPSSF